MCIRDRYIGDGGDEGPGTVRAVELEPGVIYNVRRGAWPVSYTHLDRNGNVNVSSFNRRCTGPGGFINISQSTPKVYFMCAFTAGKTEIQVGDGKLSIRKDGAGVKFVEKVQQVTFSADYARQTGQEAVSYTHLDVYKRQPLQHANHPARARRF